MCKHYWDISTGTYGEHIIGKCKLCGETRDFTVLQAVDKGWGQICLVNTLTRPEVSMTTIMADRTGKITKKPKSKLSRGRVR
uniref:Uncharacterized protein n=1 Tax=viral metagenome TaxID=1070528 RepID=A0A6M3IR17_9ZZZZ